MTRYSVQPRHGIFVKGYGFLSFPTNMSKNIGENISKNLTDKYSLGMLAIHQKLLDHAKQSATDAFKTASKRAIQKITQATDDLIGNKIINKITKAHQKLQDNNSETVINDPDKEIPKERYISPEERQEIIDDFRLKQ